MRSACAVAFLIGLTVRSALGSDPSEAALEEALQHDDACANSDDSKCSVELLQRAAVEGATENDLDANQGEDEEVIEFVESHESAGCPIAEQGTTCHIDADCTGRSACCQDTVAKKIGVKPCHQCSQTCHPTSHKCKCN